MAATTLATLKADALRGYRARQLVVGTVASYNTTWLQDSNRQEPQGEWDRIDSWLKFTSGAATGVESRVTGFSAGNQSIVFAPSVPSLSTSTTYQIAKTFSNADMLLAVNSALRDMAPERIIQSFATAAETGDQRWVSVQSAAANAIAETIRVDRSVGTTNSGFDYRQVYDGADFWTDSYADGSKVIRLAYTAASGTLLRFHYRRPAAELSADTDSTDEPVSLILAGTRKWLASMEGDGEAMARFGREFEAAKVDYAKARSVRTIKIPHIRVYY